MKYKGWNCTFKNKPPLLDHIFFEQGKKPHYGYLVDDRESNDPTMWTWYSFTTDEYYDEYILQWKPMFKFDNKRK